MAISEAVSESEIQKVSEDILPVEPAGVTSEEPSAHDDVPMDDPELATDEKAEIVENPAAKAEEHNGADVVDGGDDEKRQKACEQIEFYFADSNLPFDRFMWTLHTANEEHWVPIATVASFKRMRAFAPFGVEWVANALRLSTELEVDESNTKVRRRTEIQEPVDQFDRSVYAKGFGKDEPGLQVDLEKFFAQYGKTKSVRMRREHETKEFKGSVFAEFADIASVDAFLKADPKPTWKGEELIIMSKEAYCEMKIKEKGLTGKAATLRKQQNTSGGRKGFNAFREMETKKNSKGKAKDTVKPEIWLEFMGKKIRVHDDDGGSVKEDEVPYVKGSALKFTGCGGEVNWREEIKNPLQEKFSRAPFVKYSRGDDWGLVGFDKALSEDEIKFVRENVKTIGSKDVTWVPAEELEEKAFLIERANAAAQKAVGTSAGGSSRGGRGGRGKGRGGRGGRGGGRGGGGGGERRDKGSKESSNGKGDANGEEQAGEKRKRAVEPDGGIGVGVRGQGVPVVQSAKKVKTDEAPDS